MLIKSKSGRKKLIMAFAMVFFLLFVFNSTGYTNVAYADDEANQLI